MPLEFANESQRYMTQSFDKTHPMKSLLQAGQSAMSSILFICVHVSVLAAAHTHLWEAHPKPHQVRAYSRLLSCPHITNATSLVSNSNKQEAHLKPLQVRAYSRGFSCPHITNAASLVSNSNKQEAHPKPLQVCAVCTHGMCAQRARMEGVRSVHA
eukprot:1161997-Pelagomonas_calceolata.AAC.9